jgi:hypothetical protein
MSEARDRENHVTQAKPLSTSNPQSMSKPYDESNPTSSKRARADFEPQIIGAKPPACEYSIRRERGQKQGENQSCRARPELASNPWYVRASRLEDCPPSGAASKHIRVRTNSTRIQTRINTVFTFAFSRLFFKGRPKWASLGHDQGNTPAPR